jgi:hypothetical protein
MPRHGIFRFACPGRDGFAELLTAVPCLPMAVVQAHSRFTRPPRAGGADGLCIPQPCSGARGALSGFRQLFRGTLQATLFKQLRVFQRPQSIVKAVDAN